MDTLRRTFIERAHQILVNILGHKRNHRGRTLADRHERSVERHVGIDLILLHPLRPEALTASSDIPVAHIVHKIVHRSGRLGDAVI